MRALHRMGIDVRIRTMPTEVPNPIRFEADTVHRSYDPVYANAHWRALVAMKPVLEQFRCRFIGKCSPVHFFWGSFDLAVTRFLRDGARRRARRRRDHPGGVFARSHQSRLLGGQWRDCGAGLLCVRGAGAGRIEDRGRIAARGVLQQRPLHIHPSL